jgi:hypothetical protein
VMLYGFGGACICIILGAAMVASFAAGLGVGVFTLFVFILPYGKGVDTVSVLFYGEIFSNHLRAKIFFLAISTHSLTGLVYFQAASAEFDKIGWRFYLVSYIFSCRCFLLALE